MDARSLPRLPRRGPRRCGPAAPGDSADFWPVWRGIIAAAHPEPIDYLFAGEAYGAELARQVGGFFVPLGGRVLGLSDDPVAGLSSSAVRADPAAHWPWLPRPVRAHYRRTICLHGAESTGKTTLTAALAEATGALTVGEYGRSHCEAHRGPLTLDDLLLIGRAQQAMIAAAAEWAGPLLLADTDALMTAAWTEMLLGQRPDELMAAPRPISTCCSNPICRGWMMARVSSAMWPTVTGLPKSWSR